MWKCGIDVSVCMYIYMCTYTCTLTYSASKKNKALPFATTWMDLEGITLGEINQTQKDKTISHLHVQSKEKAPRYREQTRLPVGRGGGLGKTGKGSRRVSTSSYKESKSWKRHGQHGNYS